MNEESFYLTKTPIKKLLVKFALPCVLAMLVSALYNIVDQIFIGAKVGVENSVDLIMDYIQKAQNKQDEVVEIKTKKSRKQKNHA